MKKINLSITGCMGRMGQQLIKSSKKDKSIKLYSLTEGKTISKKIYNIKPQLNTRDAFRNTDVIIDFTIPKCTFEVLKIASKLKKRVVIGTTGFTKKEEDLIKSYSKKIPILKAGNMSMGINLLMYLTEITSSVLGYKYLSKVFEVHHKHKKDYPSGTALMLGKGIAIGKNKDFYFYQQLYLCLTLKLFQTDNLFYIYDVSQKFYLNIYLLKLLKLFQLNTLKDLFLNSCFQLSILVFS